MRRYALYQVPVLVAHILAISPQKLLKIYGILNAGKAPKKIEYKIKCSLCVLIQIAYW